MFLSFFIFHLRRLILLTSQFTRFGLGRRNALSINASDFLDNSASDSEDDNNARSSRHQKIRDTPRSVKEITMLVTDDGVFLSPLEDGFKFGTYEEVVQLVTYRIKDMPQSERKCSFCELSFSNYTKSEWTR